VKTGDSSVRRGQGATEILGTKRLTQLRSKIQDPRSREDPRTKNRPLRAFQPHQRCSKCRETVIGSWNLDLLWILDLGSWCFWSARIT